VSERARERESNREILCVREGARKRDREPIVTEREGERDRERKRKESK